MTEPLNPAMNSNRLLMRPVAILMAGAVLSACSLFSDDDGGKNDGVDEVVTTNVDLVSQYTLVARNNEPGSPFVDDQMVLVVVGEDTLTIDDGTPLTDPFKRSSNAQIIWLHPDENIEYSLSNNASGVFQRIEVGDASNPDGDGNPATVGRLVETSGGGGGSGQEITGLVDGVRITIRDETGSEFSTTEPVAGHFEIEARGNQTGWLLRAPLQVGTANCSPETTAGANDAIYLAVGDSSSSAVADGDGGTNCTITITQTSPSIEGTFEGTGASQGEGGVSFREITAGEFTADPP